MNEQGEPIVPSAGRGRGRGGGVPLLPTGIEIQLLMLEMND